jgi:hypothetical protein
MVALAASLAGLASAGIGIGKSLFGGNAAQEQAAAIQQQQLADARANALNARIGAANINQLATAGFSDSFGSSIHYDPATGTWVSTLGQLPKEVQTASDQATILRNTTDLRQAQGANERADINAARAQPLINAAQMRLSQFRPQTTDDLSSLLQESAVNANNATYRPIVADTLRQFARTGNAAGPALADIGRQSSRDLREAMIQSRIAGLQNVGQLNNQRRQGLQSDLATAQAAGTPQFQYPGLAANNPNQAMLSALTDRARTAGYNSALGQSAATGAIGEAGKAATAAAGAVPDPLANLTGAATGFDTLSKTLKDKDFAAGLASLKGLFGPSVNGPQDPANALINS